MIPPIAWEDLEALTGRSFEIGIRADRKTIAVLFELIGRTIFELRYNPASLFSPHPISFARFLLGTYTTWTPCCSGALHPVLVFDSTALFTKSVSRYARTSSMVSVASSKRQTQQYCTARSQRIGEWRVSRKWPERCCNGDNSPACHKPARCGTARRWPPSPPRPTSFRATPRRRSRAWAGSATDL